MPPTQSPSEWRVWFVSHAFNPSASLRLLYFSVFLSVKSFHSPKCCALDSTLSKATNPSLPHTSCSYSFSRFVYKNTLFLTSVSLFNMLPLGIYSHLTNFLLRLTNDFCIAKSTAHFHTHGTKLAEGQWTQLMKPTCLRNTVVLQSLVASTSPAVLQSAEMIPPPHLRVWGASGLLLNSSTEEYGTPWSSHLPNMWDFGGHCRDKS